MRRVQGVLVLATYQLSRDCPRRRLAHTSLREEPCEEDREFKDCQSVDYPGCWLFDKCGSGEIVGSFAQDPVEEQIDESDDGVLVPIDRAGVGVDILVERIKIQAVRARLDTLRAQFGDSFRKNLRVLPECGYIVVTALRSGEPEAEEGIHDHLAGFHVR